MINELYRLSKTLEEKGIASIEWHREYKTLPKVTAKAPCVRLWLNGDGSICDLESLPSELAAKIRKYGNNQNSFPAFNINALYRLTDSVEIEKLSEYETGKTPPDIFAIRSLCRQDNWIKDAPGQVLRCLTTCPAMLIAKTGGDIQNTILGKLTELCEALCRDSEEGFRASLEACLFEKLTKGEDVPLALSILFHKGSDEKAHDKDTGARLSVVLDVKDWQAYEYPVASEHTTVLLNKLLLKSGNAQAEICGAGQVDAFGERFVNPDEPMPSVKLSGFEVTLRSMFGGQPCQHRYGAIDDASYPISPGHRSSVKRALEWMAEPSRNGVTWVKVDQNEIVFAYPSVLSEVPPRFASIFGRTADQQGGRAEARFEAAAREFNRVFTDLPTNQRPDRIRIFTIRKLDKARSKVIFTHSSTPEELIQAAADWSCGFHNIPTLDVGEPEIPFPLEAAGIFNAVWKQSGERADGKAAVKRMKYYQGMELLLGLLPDQAIKNALHVLLENDRGLVYCLGNRLRGGKSDAGGRGAKTLELQKQFAAKACAMLGLLLYKHNIRKEIYMEDFAYLFGQLLHAADDLHAMYCQEKRKGDVPPELAGSALFTAAGTNPYQAMSLLSTRIQPYYAWAKQFWYKKTDKTPDGTPKEKEGKRRHAKYLINLFDDLSARIHPWMKPDLRFGDYEKAQLFIGYMAALPKSENGGKTEVSDQTNTNMNDMGGKDDE